MPNAFIGDLAHDYEDIDLPALPAVPVQGRVRDLVTVCSDAPPAVTVKFTVSASERDLLERVVLDAQLVDRLAAQPGGRKWTGAFALWEIDELAEELLLAADDAETPRISRKLEAVFSRLEIIQSENDDSNWYDGRI